MLLSIMTNSAPLNRCVESESTKGPRGDTDQDMEEYVWVTMNIKPGCRQRATTIKYRQVYYGGSKHANTWC